MTFAPWNDPDDEQLEALGKYRAKDARRTMKSVREQVAAAASTTETERGEDMVTMPKHYARFQIEPIRFIAENGLNWFQGNIVKYFMRFDAKNGLEDVRKGIRYALMFEQFLMGNPDWWRSAENWRRPSWCPEKWKEA